MIEEFTAKIGARIKDFQRKMKQVDKMVQQTAMEATKPITADINDFYSSILEVESLTAKAVKKAEKEVTVDLNDFYLQMAEMQAETKLATKPSKKSISADISDFMRKAAQVAVVARTLSQTKIIIPIVAKWKKYQDAMMRYVAVTRAFGEVAQNVFKGIGITLSSGLVPIIAVVAGAIANLGPMLGVLAGSTFALGSAFGVAGVGVGAFAAIAVSNLKDVFGASSDIKDIQKKLASETDDKKRGELLAKITQIQKSLNKEQLNALGAMNKLKSTWGELSKSLEKPTINIFTDFLGIMGDTLGRTRPLFRGVVTAVQSLTTSLGKAMKGERMMAFFKYLNTSAGPILETIGKAFGNFIQGILSMVTAFGGLTNDTSKGFLAMSESFADWAAGLGESKKFQSFVDYVKENMPKIRSIFSDAFQGIINVFAGFAPSSSDMMTSLQDMMERFKEWSSTISNNQGFQNFLTYIKENGPKTVALIGNVVMSIVNLGIALAPMGAKVLEVVNAVIAWTNGMMKNHPILGKIIAGVLLITGALLFLAPNIIAFGVLFSGAGSLIGGAMTLIMARTALMRAKFVTGMTMMITSMVKSATAMAVNTAKIIAKWVLMGTKSMIQGAKVAAAWTLSTGKALAVSVGKMIATSAVFVAKWVWMGVQSLLQAGRMAAAWFIALGPVGWVIGAIVGLAIIVIANWDTIKKKTIEIWNKVSNAVKEAADKMVKFLVEGIAKIIGKLSEMPGKVRAFVGDMKQAGADLISGVIKGITGKIGEGLAAIGGFASGLLARFKKDTGVKSPSRKFADIAKYLPLGVVKGIGKTSHLAVSSISSLATDLSSAFNPQLAMADMQANATLNTSVSRADMKAVQHSFAAEVGGLEIEQPDLVLMVDGKELGKVVAKPVAEENNRRDKMINITKGKR